MCIMNKIILVLAALTVSAGIALGITAADKALEQKRLEKKDRKSAFRTGRRAVSIGIMQRRTCK